MNMLEIENPCLTVGEEGVDASDELAAKAVELLLQQHSDELQSIAEDLYQQECDEMAAEAAIARWEDERDAPYTSYEEGKALDEYERAHGW
jgi:hypothetical protein